MGIQDKEWGLKAIDAVCRGVLKACPDMPDSIDMYRQGQNDAAENIRWHVRSIARQMGVKLDD